MTTLVVKDLLVRSIKSGTTKKRVFVLGCTLIKDLKIITSLTRVKYSFHQGPHPSIRERRYGPVLSL